jgi:hypothetical protein
MRNDAPVVLAEWAARVNAETRAFMGVVVRPELPERQEARAYLAGLMSDQEAAACVAADLARVRVWRDDFITGCDQDDRCVVLIADDDEYAGLSSSFAAACRAADEKQGRNPEFIERKSAPNVVPRPVERIPISILWAAEYLVREGAPSLLRYWLAKHGTDERAAIQKRLGRQACR